MDLANATNGVFVPYEGWIGPERSATVRNDGAVMVADPLMVYALYYLAYINIKDAKKAYKIRLSKEVLDIKFCTFYTRRGEPWKEQFDIVIM